MRQRMTDFELTIQKLRPIFEASGFKTIDSFKNFIKLESTAVTVAIGYDERENSNFFFVGQTDRESHLLNSKNLKEIFNYDKQAINFEDFVVDFLKNEGIGILTNDTTKLIQLDNYEQKQAKSYTDKILNRRRTNTADSAWKKKDYLIFIKTIDEMDKDDLPSSYKLKYKIACDRIGETK
jgi:hypothetical protein